MKTQIGIHRRNSLLPLTCVLVIAAGVCSAEGNATARHFAQAAAEANVLPAVEYAGTYRLVHPGRKTVLRSRQTSRSRHLTAVQPPFACLALLAPSTRPALPTRSAICQVEARLLVF